MPSEGLSNKEQAAADFWATTLGIIVVLGCILGPTLFYSTGMSNYEVRDLTEAQIEVLEIQNGSGDSPIWFGSIRCNPNCNEEEYAHLLRVRTRIMDENAVNPLFEEIGLDYKKYEGPQLR